MEKRRNTLDRWQRLRFGRRSASNPPEDKKPTTPTTPDTADATGPTQKRASDKTERLRELTELLKGTKSAGAAAASASSPIPPPPPPPPPIPPPRRPRHPSSSGASSVEKYIDASPSDSTAYDDGGGTADDIGHASSPLPSASIRSSTSSPITGNIFNLPPFTPPPRPNSSAASFDSTRNMKTPPLAEAEDHSLTTNEVVDALPRAESKTIVGSYTQKTIPFRSASFSQVDYTSGKYIRSTLCAFKAATLVTKERNHSVVDSSNYLTLPRKKDGSRSASPSNIDADAAPATPTIEEPPLLPWPSDGSGKRAARILNDLNLNLGTLAPPPEPQRRRTIQGANANVIIEEDNEGSPTVDSREMNYSTGDKDRIEDVLTVETPTEASLRFVQASEYELATEEMSLQSPKPLFNEDEYLQTATQCLIPLPVACRDWNDVDLGDRWINACEVESSRIIEGLNAHLVNAAVSDALNQGTSNNEQVIAEAVEAFELPSTVEEQNAMQTVSDMEGGFKLDQIQHATEIMPDEVAQPTVADACDPAATPTVNLSDEPLSAPCESAPRSQRKDPEKTNSLILELEELPAISVTPGSSLSGSSFDDVNPPPNTDDKKADSEPNTPTDYVVEVRKRHSNGSRNSDKVNTDHSRSGSASGNNSPKSSMDEKRRIDKSKRRKGIYIQWGAIEQHHRDLSSISWDENSPEHTANTVDDPRSAGSLDSESDIDFAALSVSVATAQQQKQHQQQQQIDQSEGLWLKCRMPEDGRLPPSGYEPNTPDSEFGRPIWPKNSGSVSIRRQSLSLQSSEEKDDSPTNSSPSSKPHHKLYLLRSDSLGSDNDMSDRTPPSRDPCDRASQSPAPGEQDLKRYSKRPLRGPYGQMLEAEMKKPAKTNYDGLLEELNRSER